MTVAELKKRVNAISDEHNDLEVVTDPTSPPIEGYNPLHINFNVIQVIEKYKTSYLSLEKLKGKKVMYAQLT